mmetsp:Transcript_7606/g.12305  ORF Transcript_7606/g.12305 Transcript_7606/m.12305 type:complete len:273 (-) Transcript_7606:44-862(-)
MSQDQGKTSPVPANDPDLEEQGKSSQEEKTCNLKVECVAELMGTMVFVFLGTSVVAQKVMTNGSEHTIEISVGFGIALAIGILIAHRHSGGHLNPAVTFALWTIGSVPNYKMLPYMVSQFLGAFLGAVLTFMFYWDLFQADDGKAFNNSGCFGTIPAPYMSWFGAFVDEAIGAGILMIAIIAVCDSKPVTVWHAAGYIGATLTVIGMALGANTGFAINPARDFGPRVFTSMAGWGGKVYSANQHYFLAPLIAPFVGATIAAQLMKFTRAIGC